MLAHIADNNILADLRLLFIVKGEFYGKLVIKFKTMDMRAGEFEAADGNILDDQGAAILFLRMVDIRSAQACSLAHTLAEFEADGKYFLAAAFDLQRGLAALE